MTECEYERQREESQRAKVNHHLLTGFPVLTQTSIKEEGNHRTQGKERKRIHLDQAKVKARQIFFRIDKVNLRRLIPEYDGRNREKIGNRELLRAQFVRS